MNQDETFKIFRDGDKWCAVREDFTNLQESPAGFGATRSEAFKDLMIKLTYEKENL